MTPDQVREFQGAHLHATESLPFDWEGKRLKVDGDFGPRTQWAYAVSQLDPRRQQIIHRAVHHVGLTEKDGPNRSPLIDGWNQRAGAPIGSAYCASFASWCISVPGLPDVRQAGAQKLGSSLQPAFPVQPGDVMWFPTGNITGHCGIVVGIGAGEVACVEGNQDNAVRLVRRTMAAPVKFGRSAPIAEPPGVPDGLRLVTAAFAGTR